MAADSEAMDPRESPARPGVRRVNNMPLLIIAGTVGTFLAIMAYVAAGRADNATEAGASDTVRSARSLADDVVGEAEAGVVPARDLPVPASAAGSNTPSNDLPLAGGLPDLGAPDPTGLPPMPPPPAGFVAQDASLVPPEGMTVIERDRASSGYATSTDETVDDLKRMKLDMFKQAVRASSAPQEGFGASSTAATDPRIEAARAERGALAAQMGGGAFMDKLRGLQAAGLLPSDGQGKPASAPNAYARFDGRDGEDRWKLGADQEIPGSRYELRAGAVIPATLQSGINSELPGQITALVAQDVRDTATGTFVLIPQGARLVGSYGADVQYGQERVLVAWQRILWPDGKVLDIGAMPGADGAGYAGFKDLVDNHFWRLFGGALLLSGITGGVAYSQDALSPNNDRTTVGSAMGQAVGQQLGQVSEEMIRKQMNVAPTLEIRPGYRFNVQVTKDLTFNAPYRAFDYDRSIAAGGQTYAIARSE